MRIVVIGAGPAGLMAAAAAGAIWRTRDQPGEIVVLEKNRKAGVKILMSGGTRCNLTHDCGPAGIMEAFGKNGSFLRQALHELPPADVVDLFRSLGVDTQVEPVTGKIFPTSNRALDVRDALLKHTLANGAVVNLDTSVQAIERHAEHFIIRASGSEWIADRVIVASGGRSYPGCGTIGEGYQWMQTLGHTIVPTRPALVPLVGGEAWMRDMSGVTLDQVSTSVWEHSPAGGKQSKRPLLTRTGGFLFTHFGFSGPTAMDVSRYLAAENSAASLTLDLLPTVESFALESWLQEMRAKEGKRKVLSALAERLPKRLAEAIAVCSGASERIFAELPRDAGSKIITMLKRLPLPVTGTRGYEKAEVTAGGVALKEVDPRTMQSRIVPGLYLVGEILDLDGWIGGYNFQSAFSTGFVAGRHAAAAE